MDAKLNIAFFGSSLVSAYWNGAATYYRGLIRALHARGHLVTFYEPDAFERQAHRDMEDPSWARVVVYQPHAVAIEEVLERARSADVIVKASGVGVNDVLLECAVYAAESRQHFHVAVSGLDGIAIASDPVLDVDATGERSLAVRVQVPPETAGRTGTGAHPIRFEIRRDGDERTPLVERSTFLIPR